MPPCIPSVIFLNWRQPSSRNPEFPCEFPDYLCLFLNLDVFDLLLKWKVTLLTFPEALTTFNFFFFWNSFVIEQRVHDSMKPSPAKMWGLPVYDLIRPGIAASRKSHQFCTCRIFSKILTLRSAILWLIFKLLFFDPHQHILYLFGTLTSILAGTYVVRILQ
jgi:hypothetical protein